MYVIKTLKFISVISCDKVLKIFLIVQKQQLELDVLLERAREVIAQAEPKSRATVEKQSGELSERWSALVSGLESRRDTLAKLAQLWEEFENRWQGFESRVLALDERAKHVDPLVRSRQHVLDTKTTLQVRKEMALFGGGIILVVFRRSSFRILKLLRLNMKQFNRYHQLFSSSSASVLPNQLIRSHPG